MVAHVSSVAAVVHLSGQKNMTSSDKVKEYYIHMSRGRYRVHLRMILEKVFDGQLLDLLGIGEFADMDVPKKGSPTAYPMVQAAMREEPDTLKDLWLFAFALFRWRALSLSHYDMSMPGIFALLLYGQADIKALGMRKAAGMWGAIQKAEEAAKADRAVASLLDAAVCVNFTFAREVLLALAQWDFQHMPAPTMGDLEVLFGGFGHSCVDEEAFNRIKDHQRDSKNMRMSRIKRWQWPVLAKVLGRYQREEISPDCARLPPGMPRRLPPQMFDGLAGNPSVSEQDLKRITGVACWKTPTPTGAHNIVAALNLLLFCASRGDWSPASLAWRSVFCVVGSLLLQKLEKRCYLVLVACQFGFLGLPCQV